MTWLPADALAWLGAQEDEVRWYWAGRREGNCIAAVGIADLCQGNGPDVYADMRRCMGPVLEQAPFGTRYFGGIRFDYQRPQSAEWLPFHSFQFILPRFELLVDDSASTLTCNLVLPRDTEKRTEVLADLSGLAPAAYRYSVASSPILVRRDSPEAGGWEKMVLNALQSIREGSLSKIVLARRVAYSFEDVPDPVSLMRDLEVATPNCFHYFFQVAPGSVFLGATPERLFRREDDTIWSEAVAGTRRRGSNESDDAFLLSDLLGSDKDQREHAFVRDSIHETLAPLCATLDIDACASEMKLAKGRHLLSSLTGRLKDGVTTLDLLSGLHPTPAVGGVPRVAARDAIRKAESFDRGWYAGPIGWIGVNGAEFAVALRCGLLQSDRLSLYSGAGIVEGSEPASEWAEIEHKISDITGVLGLDEERAEF